MLKLLRGKSGQSLIELLVAISVTVVAILGILSLVNRSLGLNRVNADHYTATYLAAEGIELTKNFFDKKFLEEKAGSAKFYGWGPPNGIRVGIYQPDFNDFDLEDTEIKCPGYNPKKEPPTQAEVEDIFDECTTGVGKRVQPLRLSPDGYYSYDLDGGAPTKFRRVIIVDNPYDQTVNQEYRVTSAVGWSSRGGKFVVQLQDHFLPWRIP